MTEQNGTFKKNILLNIKYIHKINILSYYNIIIIKL